MTLKGNYAGGLEHRETIDQPETDDREKPDKRHDDRDPVEVALSHSRRPQARGDTTAEHIGETAPAPLVEQNEQREQQARQHQHDDQ